MEPRRIIHGLKRHAMECWRLYRTCADMESLRNYARLQQGGDGDVSLRLRGGHTVCCRAGTTDAHVFRDTFCARYHLPPHGLRPGTILDLGSNIGTTILHYARLYPEARILGIELDAANFAVCRRNIAALGCRCAVVHGAAWWEDGEIAYGGAEEWGFRVQGNGARKAVAYSIAHLLDLLGPAVDFVKMDIEGAEAEILPRAQAWIGRVRCLKIEIHEPYSTGRCIADLRGFGFACERDRSHPNCVVARQ